MPALRNVRYAFFWYNFLICYKLSCIMIYANMDHNREHMTSILEMCKNELDLDKRIELLYAINKMLPESRRLRIPSLITKDYVYQAIYRIEEMLMVA